MRRNHAHPPVDNPSDPVSWVGARSHLVLVACLLVVAGTWGFILVADKVMEGRTQRFDEWAVRALRKPDDPAVGVGPKWLPEVARDVTALGGVTTLTLVTAAVAGYLLLDRKYGALVVLLVATVGGLGFNALLKHLFVRPRPQVVPHLSDVFTTSFPSGHSMLSAVVYLTLGSLLARFSHRRRDKAYFVALALVLTFLIGVSRIYMGVHYPTDVMAGWSAGLVWALLCWLVARHLQRRGAVEPDVAEEAGTGRRGGDSG